MRLGGLRRDLALFTIAMLAIIAVRVALVGGPQFFNDAYQYLSITENLVDHHAVETSIVHFDEERSRHVLPAPETTFPPGYPLLIAALSWTHVSPEWIGFVLSLLAGVAVLPLLYLAARALGLGRFATRACLGLWAFSSIASLYAITLYAEALFTCVVLAAMVLLLSELGSERRRPSWRVPVGLLLLGASFWVRYAGLFFVVALHAFVAGQVLRSRRGIAAWLASLAACDVLVGLLMLRNVKVAGVWTGGNSRPVHVPASTEAWNLLAAVYEVIFGTFHDPRSAWFAGLVVAVLVGAGAIAWHAAKATEPRRVLERAAAPQVALLWIAAAGYFAALLYAGATTQISLSARMLLPLIPIVGLLLGALAESAPAVGARLLSSRRAAAVAALLPAAYVVTNLASSFAPPPLAEHRRVEAALSSPSQGGKPLLEWLEANVPADAVLLAVEGQATGHVLHRRTISVVGQAFTSLTWSEDEVRRIVEEFGVSYVIVYPEVIAAGSGDHLSSHFLEELGAKHPPPWMELAATNAHAVVYRPVRDHLHSGATGAARTPSRGG